MRQKLSRIRNTRTQRLPTIITMELPVRNNRRVLTNPRILDQVANRQTITIPQTVPTRTTNDPVRNGHLVPTRTIMIRTKIRYAVRRRSPNTLQMAINMSHTRRHTVKRTRMKSTTFARYNTSHVRSNYNVRHTRIHRNQTRRQFTLLPSRPNRTMHHPPLLTITQHTKLITSLNLLQLARTSHIKRTTASAK